MKSTVKIKIIPPSVQDIADNTYTVYGRLLGVCNNIQASKIIRNNEVASKIFTGVTISLKQLSDAMTEEFSENDNNSFGRPVITVSAIEKSNEVGNDEKIQSIRKNLLVLNEVSLLSESTISKLTMECKDGSTAVMEACNEKE